MFKCLYDGCFVRLRQGYVCADHRCETDCCMNVKKCEYDMCEQHIIDDKKYNNELFLRKRFDVASRIVQPINFQYADGSIIQSVLVQSFQYTCCVCDEEIDGEIYRCSNYHALCSGCRRSMKLHGLNNCPVCRLPELERDTKTESIILGILKKCGNYGCQFKSFPSKFDEHKCIYVKIGCFICGKLTTPFDLQAHFITECFQTFQEIRDGSNFSDFVKNSQAFGCRYYTHHEDLPTIYVDKCRRYGIVFYVIQLKNNKPHTIQFAYELDSYTYTVNLKTMTIGDLCKNPIRQTHINPSICNKLSSVYFKFS